jgi:hypothetical protein
MNKVFKTWGKQNDTATPIWKDYWTYVVESLDGTWGEQTFTGGVVNYNGKECYWKTKVFVATTAVNLTIPVQAYESYGVTIQNLTTGAISCKLIGAKTNTFSSVLSVGNSYQIISNHFIPVT